MVVLGCPARYVVALESLNLTSGAGEGTIITASLIFGDFQVKMLQGNIDISFRVKGHKGTHLPRAVPSLLIFVRLKDAGTVYFTSIRRERGGPFTTCAYAYRPFSLCPNVPIITLIPFPGPNIFHTVRFKVIADDGTVILIPCETPPVGDEAHVS